MKFICLTAIILLPIVITDVALASDIPLIHPASPSTIQPYYSNNEVADVRQGLPERRISGSSR
ncbi:MAG: hypothetical protein AAFY17_04515 [Cyanobacteria bacterium J06642_11]